MRKRTDRLILILLASILFVSIAISQVRLDSICLNYEYDYWEELDSQTVRITVSNGDSLEAIFCRLIWNDNSLRYMGVSEYGTLQDLGPVNFFNVNPNELRIVWDHPLGEYSSIEECELFFQVSFVNKTGKVIMVNEDESFKDGEFVKPADASPASLKHCCNRTTTTKGNWRIQPKLIQNPVSGWEDIRFTGIERASYELYNLRGNKMNRSTEIESGLYILVVKELSSTIAIKLLVQ
jgi:hypothetical protein